MTASAPHVPLNDLGRGIREQSAGLTRAIRRVTESGWLVHGPEHAAFEREFAEMLDVEHCVAVGNGTDALALALAAVGVKAGDEVVTAANAGFYASTAARMVGAVPMYADVDPDSLLLDPECVGEAITPASKALVVTHLYGRLAPMDGLTALCRQRGLALVEDCAQAVGAARGGIAAGASGDVGTYSFYPTKNLGALGDGGAIVTRNADIEEAVSQLRQYGWSAKYTVTRAGGMNSRLDEVQAAVLRERLPRVSAWATARRAIINRYAEAAVGGRVRVLNANAGDDYVGHLAVVQVLDGPEGRDDLRRHMREAGVGTEIHYPVPDHLQPVNSHRSLRSLPVTEHAARSILTLPCFPELTQQETDRVCEALADWAHG